jgi:hypothetical protein
MFADTLVLKIVEYENGNLKKPDTTLYILYDKMEQTYVIRGKRSDKVIKSCTYSFECKSSKELTEFIDFLICSKNSVSYSLYNYDNLPSTSDEIDFDFLHTYDDICYELSGYDNPNLEKKELRKILRMLRNVFNYY